MNNTRILIKSVSYWVKGARVYTLPIGLVPVLMAVSLSLRVLKTNGVQFSSNVLLQFIVQAVLCACVSVGMQVSVNYANDYCDGIRGLDDNRNLRSVQGQKNKSLCDVSWRLADAGISPKKVKIAILLSAAFACVCGFIVTVLSGLWWMIALGAFCLLGAWFYAGGKHPYGYSGWGEVSAFFFFGPVAFLGTLCAMIYSVGISSQNVHFTSLINIISCVLVSFIPGGYSACLMMINNLRDINEDKKHGKITAMARLGERNGRILASLQVALFTTIAIAYVFFAVVKSTFLPSIWVIGDVSKLNANKSSNSLFLFLFIILTIVLLLIILLIIMKARVLIKSLLEGNYRNSFGMCVLSALLGALAFILAAFIG